MARRTKLAVRVHYPLEAGELRLRSDHDWERDLAPVRVDRDEQRFDFELPGEAAFHYFKPVLARDGELAWAQGDNALAFAHERSGTEVFPWFSPDESCHVCTAHTLPASFAERGLDVRVFLPRGYDENTLARFPVLYMQDGKNLFSATDAPAGEHWRIPETLALLEAMCLVRRVIVVGIAPSERMRDYTQPGYEAYGRWLVEELEPWVARHYRTLSGPENRAVMGSSLGGVVSFYLAWQHADVFGGVAALSATFGYQDDLVARVLGEKRRSIRVYLDSGWPRDNYEATRGMAAALKRRGFQAGCDLLHLAHPLARHDERAWAARVHVPLQFLLGSNG